MTDVEPDEDDVESIGSSAPSDGVVDLTLDSDPEVVDLTDEPEAMDLTIDDGADLTGDISLVSLTEAEISQLYDDIGGEGMHVFSIYLFDLQSI